MCINCICSVTKSTDKRVSRLRTSPILQIIGIDFNNSPSASISSLKGGIALQKDFLNQVIFSENKSSITAQPRLRLLLHDLFQTL